MCHGRHRDSLQGGFVKYLAIDFTPIVRWFTPLMLRSARHYRWRWRWREPDWAMAHKEWEGTAHSGHSLHPYLRPNLNSGSTSLSVKPPENSGSRYGSPAREPLVLSNRTASKGAHVKWLPSPEEEAPRPARSQRRSDAVSRLDTVYASPAVLRQLHRLVRKTSQTRSPRTHDLLRDTVRELRSAMHGADDADADADSDADADAAADSIAGTPQQQQPPASSRSSRAWPYLNPTLTRTETRTRTKTRTRARAPT